MPSPIVLPELGAGSGEVRVSGWLVERGDAVEAGDRVVEVLLRGITFVVSVSESGILSHVDKERGALVSPGDLLGWIETVE